MAGDRGAYIDQSQSLNVHIAAPSVGKLTSMHFFAWKSGLKTGMYYLRTRPKASAIQFTVDQEALAATRLKKKGEKRMAESASKFASAKQAQKAAWKAVDATKGMSFEASQRKAMQEKQAEEDSEVCLNCSS